MFPVDKDDPAYEDRSEFKSSIGVYLTVHRLTSVETVFQAFLQVISVEWAGQILSDFCIIVCDVGSCG